MEQFFEITKESRHYKEYFDYIESREKLRLQVNTFFKDFGINSAGYIAKRDRLYIDGNASNRKQFGNKLLANGLDCGAVQFRKNSDIGKAWAKLNIEEPDKPYVPFFFANCPSGRMRTRMFAIEDRAYCSISTQYDTTLGCPEGFREMKGSEFHAAMESLDSKHDLH